MLSGWKILAMAALTVSLASCGKLTVSEPPRPASAVIRDNQFEVICTIADGQRLDRLAKCFKQAKRVRDWEKFNYPNTDIKINFGRRWLVNLDTGEYAALSVMGPYPVWQFTPEDLAFVKSLLTVSDGK